jgi:GTPase SAR1 family protein
VASTCHLIPSLLNKPQLLKVEFDNKPSSCVRDEAWRRAGLAVPPDEVVGDGWEAVLEFLSAGATVAVHELRLMLIGDGEAGKTSLQRAFAAPGHKAERIGKEERTVGIDFSELLFDGGEGPSVKCQVCDFAGQAIYYLSHTMHFTRRCLYVLMWTAHKFSESGAAQELALEDILLPLKRWLQLLAANVPEASVVVVGTHCRVQPERFEAMRVEVGRHVREEIDRLHFMADAESAATRELLQRQRAKASTLLGDVAAEGSAMQLQTAAPGLELKDVEKFVHELNGAQPVAKRGLMQKAELLLKTVQDVWRNEARLCRLHGVHDGSIPDDAAPAARLKLVNERSFAVDSVEGVGVAELLAAIEATCRDTQALPFMGELVPETWLQVSEALQKQQQRQLEEEVHDGIGDFVISVKEAVGKVRSLLQTELGAGFGQARGLDSKGVQSSLEFWSLLGRVFVHDGHFLRDPRLLVDLLKPLVHHDVTSRLFRKEFLVNATDFSCDEPLALLQKHAVLDHRLLPKLKSWASSSAEAQLSMLKFFQDTFIINVIQARDSGEGLDQQRSLVTARLFDSSDGASQREVDTQADGAAASAVFHAVYALPSAHIGIIAHVMATLQSLQPAKLRLASCCGRDHVCMERVSSRCAVSMRPLPHVFASTLGSIQHELPTDYFSHALVVSSNDDGLFAFAARCVDALMGSGRFGAKYQCWLPYRSSSADSSWRPKKEDWARLNCSENPMCLSEVLSANASDVVIPSHNLKLRDVLPRRPRIFMSHTFSGDGTGECCQRIKSGLQERLLCTVWFDKAEMGWTDAFIDEMKRGMANARAFVMCLTPLYLTRPNCLRELMWAMDMCAADKTKKLCVLPLHPSVSFAGCRALVDLAAAGCAAQVILPVDDRSKQAPTRLEQLKAHKLSDVAVSLLQRLTGPENVGINAEWLKLQPWTSDAEGENWEETSQPWAGPCEGKRLELKQLLEGLCSNLQAAILADCPAYSLSAFANVNNHDLQSLPPSQDYDKPSDAALLRSSFPTLLRNFTEAEAVALMLLGLRDWDAVYCMKHGVKRDSAAAAAQLNPVDAVFRIAADMSGCFSASRSLVVVPSHSYVSLPASSSAAAPSAAGGLSATFDPEDFEQRKRMRDIGLSDDAAVLADMSAKLRKGGIMSLEDLRGLSKEEVHESVKALMLSPVQFNKLFKAVSG